MNAVRGQYEYKKTVSGSRMSREKSGILPALAIFAGLCYNVHCASGDPAGLLPGRPYGRTPERSEPL